MKRRKPPGATTRGGWGKNHQRRRAALVPYVNTGKATCVRCDGANKTNRQRPPDPYVERPYRWSQRWFDDPPVGTIVLGHEQVIYLGNGDWKPIDQR